MHFFCSFLSKLVKSPEGFGIFNSVVNGLDIHLSEDKGLEKMIFSRAFWFCITISATQGRNSKLYACSLVAFSLTH